MATSFRIAALLLTWLCATLAFAQDETPAPQTDNEEVTEQVQPDQEVEVNEDNYRQFMELKDGLQQRTVAPQDSYESGSGLQKLDNLPEASQKHLRNQLREVISQGDRWQPGDENADYPYVPSAEARTDAGLQKQEIEAWGELLDSYHAREAQIYANSARSSAALAGSGAGMSGQDGETGDKGENNASGGHEGSERPGSRQDGEAGSFTPGQQGGARTQSPEGVSQSAMEFLQNAGYQGGNSSADGAQQQAGESGQMTGQAQQGTQQAMAQAGAQGQGQSANPGAQGASQAQEPDGSEQNAMQYLQQLGQQPDGSNESGGQQSGEGGEAGSAQNQQETMARKSQDISIEHTSSESDEAAIEGVSQNALEYLAGEGAAAEDAPPDTLSIEDLFNAQGVSIGVGTGSQQEPEEPPEIPDKSGGGS